MKKVALVLLLVATLSVPNVYAREESGGNDLEDIARILTDMTRDQTFSGMMDKLVLYKRAGLSYQPQLTVPMQADCKDGEQLRTLIGMYIFDSNYAMAFGKTRDALTIKKFIRNQVRPRLHERDKLNSQPLDQAAVKALMENPGDMQAREQLRDQGIKEFKHLIEVAKTDSGVMELLVEGLSGAVIQGIYVAANLAKDAPQTPELSTFYEAQLDRLEIMDKILQTVEQDKYKALFEISERNKILSPIRDILLASKGNVSNADLDKIRDLAAKGRAPYVIPCQ